MPILTVRHETTYAYRRPVGFGAHVMMLRPRDDADQVTLGTALEIDPLPRRLAWRRDDFGNHIATAEFDSRSATLRFVSTMRLDLAPFDFDGARLADGGRRVPVAYSQAERAGLAPFMSPLGPFPEVAAWAAGFLDADGSADTRALLVAMTQTIRQRWRHAARHEPGIQSPAETLALASGSCRDVALLMIAALRALGLAARFVSGYLRVAGDAELSTGGNTHAWVQVFIPGPGWIDVDPASGTIGNRDLVRVAAVHDPVAAIPLQGTYYGAAEDHLAMTVSVAVRSLPAAAGST